MTLIKPQAQGTIPTRQLPGANLAPEQWLEENTRSQRDLIERQYQQELQGIQREAKLGQWSQPQFHQAINGAFTRGQQQLAEFEAKIQMQQRQFQRIDQLAQSGAFGNPDEVKWRITLGPEAETAMFSEQDKPETPETRRKILVSQRADIDRRLKDFAVTPSTEGRGRLGWFGPKKTKKPMGIMVFDPSLYGTDKDGRVIQGSWRKASDLEAEERRFLYTSRARNWAEERMLGGGPMSSHYKAAIVSPRTGGGAVGDQALAYLNKKTESGPRQLDEGVAMSIMQEAGGDADKARQIARSRGYNF